MRRTSPGRMSVRLDRAVLIWFATFAVGLLLGLLVGFLLGLLGRIGGDREGAATPLPPARTVTIEKPVPAPEKTAPATTAAATATASP